MIRKTPRERAQARLKNWGAWCGGGEPGDPALVHYYVKQPWTPDSTPAVRYDEPDAMRSEKIILAIRKKDGYLFRLLRSRYAYGRTVDELARSRNISPASVYNHLRRGEELFAEYWLDTYLTR